MSQKATNAILKHFELGIVSYRILEVNHTSENQYIIHFSQRMIDKRLIADQTELPTTLFTSVIL